MRSGPRTVGRLLHSTRTSIGVAAAPTTLSARAELAAQTAFERDVERIERPSPSPFVVAVEKRSNPSTTGVGAPLPSPARRGWRGLLRARTGHSRTSRPRQRGGESAAGLSVRDDGDFS
jgi:hypothetical protein